MQPDHIVSYNTTLTCSIASAFNSDKAQETLFKHFKSAYLAQVLMCLLYLLVIKKIQGWSSLGTYKDYLHVRKVLYHNFLTLR